MHINYSVQSHIGLKRAVNQDHASAHPEIGLFIVADGMGGHKGGETASKMVNEVIPAILKDAMRHPSYKAREALLASIQEANRMIYDKSAEEPELKGMGTTAVIALNEEENKFTIANIGDSRCYLLYPEGLWQITKDHSLVQEKLDAKIITREQAKIDHMKNVITRSVGFEPQVNIEIFEVDCKPGGVFLMCTDGLSGLVDDDSIYNLVKSGIFEHGDLDWTAKKLIDLANAAGGEDNVSVLILKTEG